MSRLIKEAHRSGDRKREHDAEDKSPIANTVSDKSFLRCVSGFLAIGVVTNEQVRAKTHAFPTNKHQQEVVGEDKSQHREHEQIQKRKEAIEPFVSMHVAGGEYVNQKADKGYEESISTAQPVHSQAEVSAKPTYLNPGPEVIENRFRRTECAARLEREIERHDGGNADGRA